MKAPETTNEITFSVDQVERASKLLPTNKTRESLNRLLDRKVEACCDETADCVRLITFHPLLAAAHFAFSEHRPLTLSPDMIWITILQGLAQHFRNHAERLRDRVVHHQGKIEISINRDDLHRGSPENPWAAAIGELAPAIERSVGSYYSELMSDFSTTGPLERTVCQVALLDTFQPYFEYRMVCVCGIPEVTLEGFTGDWQRLRQKVEFLEPYDLDWWLPQLRRVCDQFVRAAEGHVDRYHWSNLYKRQEAYGSDNVNGWLVTLVPYIQNRKTGSYTYRNPLLNEPDDTVTTNSLPSGISQVRFGCRWLGELEDSAMEFLGGFVGVTQDQSTLSLRPKLGWAVRQGSERDRVFAKLSAHQPTAPLDSSDFDACINAWDLRHLGELPGDFLDFYKRCNGIALFRNAIRFRPLQEIVPIDDIRNSDEASKEIRAWNAPFLRFCDLADGSHVLLQMQHSYQHGWKVIRQKSRHDTAGIVVAWSFLEFLERALRSQGQIKNLSAR